jgi:LEA14-like dessication related protein
MKINHVVYLLFSMLIFSSCGFIKPVTITGVSNFRTVSTNTKPEFRFDLALQNPNNFGVTLRKMEIGISMGEPVLAKISMLEGTRITKKEPVLVPVALSPSLDELSGLFKKGVDEFLFGKNDQQLQIRGEIIIRKFIFSRKYQIRETVKL